MDNHVKGTEFEQKYKPKDSFLSDFENRIAQWSNCINVHMGDICEIGWDNNSIEFLFIDAMKSWDLANCIIRHFYSSLILNSSYIVHQDFSHFYTPWIHLLNYRFRNYFIAVYEIPKSSSVVFKYVEPFPEEVFTTTYSLMSFTPQEIEDAFQYSIQLVSPSKRANIAAAKVMLFLHQQNLERAKHELKKYLTQGFSLQSELAIVQGMIEHE